MREAVIVSGVRTAVGKAPKGTLRATRPDDLCAAAIQGALDRVPNLDRKEVEDVIIGCAMPEGEQGMNVARVASLRAGVPIEAAAMTVNRYCASGLQSIALAAERIRGGGADVIVAGGAESMSLIPMGGHKISINPWLEENYPESYLSMGLTAERVAHHYGVAREEADEFALSSHRKALAAQSAGRFEREAGKLQSFRNGVDRPHAHLLRQAPRIRIRDETRQRLDSQCLGPLLRHDDRRRGAIRRLRRVACRHLPASVERRLELRQRFDRCIGARALIHLEFDFRHLARRREADAHRHDLLLEFAGRLRRERLLVAGQ
jgi:hypothetical protein